ncbi:hypothetical protein QEH56_07025 [Pelagicoccus enzymogenes]|uniref:GH39 family glycosyl hydrolase n=1 Tax=Pelagicoccus enzymogenes TaxID=2773457 RepID=UPI00280CF2F9|nr:hypothetical protein [Pelagicoccus enzymogenes]MDQ8197892.1 hypothetical protein [Pelagicoccus enzymogenes]
MTQALSLTCSARAKGQAFTPHWNVCVGAGRANEALRASWMEQMRFVCEECGFRYVRFHGLFHDDMFVYRENDDGSITYNFQYIDDIFDRLLDMGVKPFVELGFCPRDMARETDIVFWWKGHAAPPKDVKRWGQLVQRFTQHVVNRYGIDEVLTWYFEVWNEPNLWPFFHGSKSEYFEMYRKSAEVIKAIDPRLKVGGPSTSNFVPDARFDGEKEDTSQHKTVTTAEDLDTLDWKPVWLEDFFNFCSENKLPVDFITTHPYPTDWAFDEHGTGMKLTRGVDATPKDLALLRKLVNASPFPDAEIHLTEWSSSSSPRDFAHDYLQAATYVAKANIDSIGSVDSLSYWVFTDIFEESGAGDTAFHGGFGLVNFQSIPKPTFHTYRLLNTLGDELLARTESGAITRYSKSGKLSAIAYHYPPEVTQTIPGAYETRDVAEATLDTGNPTELTFELTDLPASSSFVLEVIDTEHGDALSAWKKIGCPDPLSRAQTQHLKTAARSTRLSHHQADKTGKLSLSLFVNPWSLVSLRQL